MTNSSVEAVNLSEHYGSFVAVSRLNLRIEGSKFVGFLGLNGAGKTTTRARSLSPENVKLTAWAVWC
ncbi:MAG: hypothetical protein ABSG57_13480 [Candidatus Bathyarchaeia archaeon]